MFIDLLQKCVALLPKVQPSLEFKWEPNKGEQNWFILALTVGPLYTAHCAMCALPLCVYVCTATVQCVHCPLCNVCTATVCMCALPTVKCVHCPLCNVCTAHCVDVVQIGANGKCKTCCALYCTNCHLGYKWVCRIKYKCVSKILCASEWKLYSNCILITQSVLLYAQIYCILNISFPIFYSIIFFKLLQCTLC